MYDSMRDKYIRNDIAEKILKIVEELKRLKMVQIEETEKSKDKILEHF